MQRIIIFVIFFYSANAQDTISLTFNDLVNLNNSSNLVFKKSDLNYQLSVEEFRNSLASFLPNFSFGDVRVDYNGSAQSTEGEFVDVDKNNKWQGLRWNLDWDLQNILLDPFRYRSKKNEAVFNKKLNNLDEQIRVYVLYYLLKSSIEKEKSVSKFILRNTSIIEQLALQVKAGLKLESDLLLAKSNLNNLKIKKISQVQKINKYNQELLQALNLDLSTVIDPSCFFYENNNYNSIVPNDLQDRLELLKIEMQKKNLKLNRNKFSYGFLLPKLSLGYNDGYFGPNFNIDTRTNNRNFVSTSLMWNIPFSSIFPSGDYKINNNLYKIKVLEKEQLEKKIKSELITLENIFLNTNKQYVLAKESFDLVQKAYKQSHERQALGTANQLELFHAEREYLNAQFLYIDLITERHKAGLQRQCSYEKKYK
jgi:hypothetical protein